MSTRSTTHFKEGGKTRAIIYRHTDGYPDGAGVDLRRFINEVDKLQDKRFGDPTYLAAKYVVFLADQFNFKWGKNPETGEEDRIRPESKLDFISVGVYMKDPDDIEYRYEVHCSGSGKPRLHCFAVSDGTEVTIPALPAE